MKKKPKYIINLYTETKVKPHTKITTKITKDNVFILCSECGKKHHIDLIEILEFIDNNYDMRHFRNDYILCKKCRNKAAE